MAATAAFPSLSELLAWPTEHLTEGADHWEATAGRWYGAFTQVWQDSLSIDWEGQAAEKLQTRTYADKVKVGGLVDQLQEAAKTARIGASDLDAARSRVRYAVEDTRAAGFDVGEDLSVTDRSTGGTAAARAARQGQAQTFAADIGQRAAQLVGLDQQVAGRIAGALPGVGNLGFEEAPAAAAPNEPFPKKHNGIQLVDRTWKQGPSQPIPPEPQPGPLPPINNGEDVRKVLDPLQNGGKRGPNGVGTRPDIKELWDSASIKRMWNYLTRNATDSPGRPGYDGVVRALPDGTEIGLRRSGKGWGDTLDVWFPGGSDDKKIHVPYAPPLISAPPQLPRAADPAPLPLPPPRVGHPPVTLPPTEVVHPDTLPPWLQNPSPPGFTVSPTHTPPLMPWDTPATAPPVAVSPAPAPSPPAGGSSLYPDLANDLAEAGKKAGAGLLAGAAIIGGLLAGSVTSSGQLAR